MRDRGQKYGIFMNRCSLVVRCFAKKTRLNNNCKDSISIKKGMMIAPLNLSLFR